MRQALNQYWKENRRSIFYCLAFSLIITLGFLGYLHFVGVPRTQARNYYNKGELLLEKGDKEAALSAWRRALTAWPEDYIRQAIGNLESKD